MGIARVHLSRALVDPLNARDETPASPFGVRCRSLAAGALIVVSGELDATNVGQLESFISRERRRGRPLILDLAELTFMDSMGLQALLLVHADIRREGGTLHLAAVQDLPARILQLTGVWDALNIHADVTEAAAAARDLEAGSKRLRS
ncbi:STAS domain-containing protein [Nonomuraea fuscirosea]|uniref:STAS domain-containing protein n=1 Tax=Nonomuraea fuscirosea TaxID=1291556 RepID=UPI003437403D